MTFTATTFYTNDYYLEQTKILGVSCKKYEVPLIVTKADDRGSWVKNCAYKAYYIYDMLMTLKTDVVWLDSDSQIVKYPELFGSIKEDFAVRAEPGKKTKKPVGREQISLPDNWPTDIDPCWFNSGTIFLTSSIVVTGNVTTEGLASYCFDDKIFLIYNHSVNGITVVSSDDNGVTFT